MRRRILTHTHHSMPALMNISHLYAEFIPSCSTVAHTIHTHTLTTHTYIQSLGKERSVQSVRLLVVISAVSCSQLSADCHYSSCGWTGQLLSEGLLLQDCCLFSFSIFGRPSKDCPCCMLTINMFILDTAVNVCWWGSGSEFIIHPPKNAQTYNPVIFILKSNLLLCKR